jgi:hypothetical protein
MNGVLFPPKGFSQRKVATLVGFITTTTNGTIDATGSANCARFTVARTGAGVYRLTLTDKWNAFVEARGTVFVAAYAAAKGGPIGRPKAYAVGASGVASTIDIEFLRSDTIAAADVPDASVIQFTIVMQDSLLTQ